MKEHPAIIAFGDSITEATPGWVSLLEAAARQGPGAASVPVINAGVGGNTSREGLARMDRDVLSRGPGLVLIEFGGNDATREPARHVPLAEFEANLATMHKRLTAAGARIALLTFPPVIDAWHTWGMDPFYRAAGGLDWYVEAYREAVRRLAAHWSAPLIDADAALRRAMRAHGVGTFIKPDGVHLLDAGNRVVVDAVLPVVLQWMS